MPWAPSRITGTPTSASAAGAIAPVRQPTCEHATAVVLGPTASASSANGTARMVAPRSRAPIGGRSGPGGPPARGGRDQRADQAGVLLVGGDDLVARPEVHPREHLADALARRGGERQVMRLAPEKRGKAREKLV